MEEVTVSFMGFIADGEDIIWELAGTIYNVIQKCNAINFLINENNSIDALVSGMIINYKKAHPEKNIRITLMLPCSDEILSDDLQGRLGEYDEVKSPTKQFISKNPGASLEDFVLDCTDYIIFHCTDRKRSEYKAARSALRKGYPIIAVSGQSLIA